VPALHNPHTSTNSENLLPYPGEVLSQSSGSVYTGVDSPETSLRGRELAIDRLSSPVYDDSPPMYDDEVGLGATSYTPVASGKR
jgi:hypothetical protein